MALVLLLLAAQSFGIAHYHQRDFRDNLAQGVQGNEVLCALCLFHFHAPANAGAPPDVGGLALVVSRLTPHEISSLHALDVSRIFSRGPPSLL